MISVVVPVHDDPLLARTIQSLDRARRGSFPVEVVVVDDASSRPVSTDVGRSSLSVELIRNEVRRGVPASRNVGADHATGSILFMTDSHVTFSDGWDEALAREVEDDVICAATIRDPDSSFRGFGCRLVVPFMGTHWNREMPPSGVVQVASSAGTALTSTTFRKVGGYDGGMLMYGAAEPEFSLRAWLSGCSIRALPAVEVFHRFKGPDERDAFLGRMRPYMIHNNLRFGLLYLDRGAALQMIRHFAMLFPEHFTKAIEMVDESDVWDRAEELRSRLLYDFEWFVRRFELRDQIGRELSTK